MGRSKGENHGQAKRFKVVIDVVAEEEIDAAQNYLEAQRKGLGLEFLAAFEALEDFLSRTPLLYEEVRQDIRRGYIIRFKYCVLYAVRGDHVFVICVYHGSVHPRRWQRRVREWLRKNPRE